jgi:hypothetical protein
VSMSRACKSMHLFTDSKVALREAVTRKSARLSPLELIAGGNADHMQKELTTKLVGVNTGHKKVNGYTTAARHKEDRGREIPDPER